MFSILSMRKKLLVGDGVLLLSLTLNSFSLERQEEVLSLPLQMFDENNNDDNNYNCLFLYKE